MKERLKSRHDSDSQVASRPRGRERRGQIIATAAQLLLEKGYSGLILRTVASRANITIGNLHYYFPTKQSLFYAIFEEESASDIEDVRVAIESASSRNSKLTAIVDAGLRVLKKPENRVWKVLIALAQHDAFAGELLARENALYHKITAEQLLQIEPALSAHRALHIARLVWAMLDGLSLQIDYSLPATADTLAMENEARGAILALVDAL